MNYLWGGMMVVGVVYAVLTGNLDAVTEQALVTVQDAHSFERAQVASGGISLSDIDTKTMQSRKIKGLYFAGEILDVCAHCGGYNLQWAWSSGALAGRSAAT